MAHGVIEPIEANAKDVIATTPTWSSDVSTECISASGRPGSRSAFAARACSAWTQPTSSHVGHRSSRILVSRTSIEGEPSAPTVRTMLPSGNWRPIPASKTIPDTACTLRRRRPHSGHRVPVIDPDWQSRDRPAGSPKHIRFCIPNGLHREVDCGHDHTDRHPSRRPRARGPRC